MIFTIETPKTCCFGTHLKTDGLQVLHCTKTGCEVLLSIALKTTSFRERNYFMVLTIEPIKTCCFLCARTLQNFKNLRSLVPQRIETCCIDGFRLLNTPEVLSSDSLSKPQTLACDTSILILVRNTG